MDGANIYPDLGLRSRYLTIENKTERNSASINVSWDAFWCRCMLNQVLLMLRLSDTLRYKVLQSIRNTRMECDLP